MAHMVKASINLILLRKGKLLLSRRANTGWMDGYYCLPGGHIERGETPRVAMAREAREELGLTIDPGQLEFVCAAARNNDAAKVEYAAYIFQLSDPALEPVNTEPGKCDELRWVDADELPDNIIPDFRIIIEEGLTGGRMYLEIGYAGESSPRAVDSSSSPARRAD